MPPLDNVDHLHPRRRRLLARIHRQYDTLTQHVRLGPVEFDFTRIADPDRVLDQVAEAEDQREKREGKRRDGDALHLPYWAELWDSGFGIGRFLVEHPDWIEAEVSRVLDLGCGMGLAGTVAAALGARVVLADLETPALLFAALNSLPYRQWVRTRQLNWRSDTLEERFDLILGADILYERVQWEALESFWRRHLSEKGRILLGEPGRQTGDAFVSWIQTRGWTLALFEQPVPTRSRPVRLMALSLR